MIDWHLVLAFVKVLVPPTAAVVGAVLVSMLGVKAFRRQKAFERRLTWCEDTYVLLDRTPLAMVTAAHYADQATEPGKERLRAAMEVSGQLVNVLSLSWLFSDPETHRAIERLAAILGAIHDRIDASGRISQPDAVEYTDACQRTSLILAARIREDMGQKPLSLPIG